MMQLPESLKKAALLIHSLDAHSADTLLDQMSESDAQRVRNAIMDLGEVDDAEQDQIIADFLGRQQSPQRAASDDGVELMFSHAAHQAKATTPPILPNSSVKPFAFLEHAGPELMAKHLLREHPQTIAVVIAHLSPERAAAIVLQFPSSIQTDVLLRVGDIADMDHETVQEVERGLEAALAHELQTVRKSGAGLATLQAILSAAGADRSALVQGVAAKDRRLAAQLDSVTTPTVSSNRLSTMAFAGSRPTPIKPETKKPANNPTSQPTRTPELEFAQLSQLDDQAWAKVLRAVDSQVALLALAGASPELVARLMRQLAPRDAKLFQRRIEQIGPVRLREIEQAQQQVARIAAQLATRGEIRVPRVKPFATAA